MNPYNYSCLRLQAAATSRSHQIDRKFTLDCKLDETATQTGVFYRKKPLEVYNAVIPRFGPTVTGHGTLILEQLENRNIPSLNSAEAIRNVRNKKQFLRIMAEASIATPSSFFPEDFESETLLIEALGGFPAVVKRQDSARGEGVYLVECQNQFRTVTEPLRLNKIAYYVQPFLSDADCSDIRCLMLGNRIIASMKRQAQKGEFRSNLFQGGTAEKFVPDPYEQNLVVRAIRETGLMFAAVDFMRTSDGPLLLEINASPGFEGLESVTNLDLAGEIIDYVNGMVNFSYGRV